MQDSTIELEKKSDLKKILIVDDEESIRLPMKNIIKKMGYDVYLAVNGEDALEQYQKNNPDLVLMDLKMPGMDGVETFFKIRQADANAKIVLMSGYGLIPTINDAFQHGLLEFAEKPLPITQLKEFLSKYS